LPLAAHRFRDDGVRLWIKTGCFHLADPPESRQRALISKAILCIGGAIFQPITIKIAKDRDPVQTPVAPTTEAPGTEGQMQCAAAPAFSLTCGPAAPPGQRQAAPAAAPQTPTQRLQALWALPDKAQFWAYIHANRTALTADREANAWLDANMSVIGNWRADNVIARGAAPRWTQAQITTLATRVRGQFPPVASVRAFVDNQYVTNEF
jgi:hypothetical protein